jgi:V/A-type H+-transporting ATPase subunit A
VDLTNRAGRIERVSGPVVHIADLADPVRFEYVEIGDEHLPGEIISITQRRAVAQLYEYGGGLSVGQPAWATGHPLTVELGPGLLGGIYDGLLRPLDDAGQFLVRRGLTRPPITEHEFEPLATEGFDVAEGEALGSLRTRSGLDHLVLVPPGLVGRLEHLAPPGTYSSIDTIANVAGTPIKLTSDWPIRHPRPSLARRADRQPFVTGQRVLDVLAPIAMGGSATVIGGFGEGKTVLLEQLAKWGAADIIIFVGCGERGNELADLIDELTELTDPRSGRKLMERTVILANTSNMPVMAREASIYTAVTVAEYFRDMGSHAVIIADSTSRWAEARRELASRTGAIPAEQGYPADLPASLSSFYQRAGRVTTLGGRDGTVTIVTSVSPPGGDVTEPVAAHTQRFVEAVWALDRDLAYARHYPAVSWHRSFSRDVDSIGRWHAANGDPEWLLRRDRLLAVLNEAARLQGIADLVGLSALPTDERLTLLGARLINEAILQQSAMSVNDESCSIAKQAALVDGVLRVHDAAGALGRAGVPASVIEGFDFSPLVRAKDDTGTDDAEAVTSTTTDLLTTMNRLAP